VENIIDELRFLEEQGFKDIEIVDDTFLLKQKRVYEFCKALKKEKLDMYWHINSRANLGNYNLFRTMVTSGCKTISIGFESGVQRILDYYSKGLKVEQSINIVKKLKKARMETIYGGFVIGAPYETIEDIKKTMKFTFKLNPTFFQFQLLNIVPGTPIYADFVKNGWLNPKTDWESAQIAADVCPEVVNKEIMEALVEKTYIKFVTSPTRLIKLYLRSLTSEYRLNMMSLMPRMLKTKV
jgi:radical SAM superfamily enzyme YgiQ (UPF0313 family)